MMLSIAPPMDVRPAMSWGIGMLLVAGASLSLTLYLSPRSADAPAMPPAPAAVMMVWAAQIASPQEQRLASVGARQSLAAPPATPRERAPERDRRPKLARAPAPEIVAAADAGSSMSPPAPPAPDTSAAQSAPQAPAAASSSAAPAPAILRAAQAAAPFNSDAASAAAVTASWQSLVLGHLGKYKRYPGDARQRKRAGAAWVRFTVDSQGRVLASELLNSSGTPALDREALQLLERAQPLPPQSPRQTAARCRGPALWRARFVGRTQLTPSASTRRPKGVLSRATSDRS